jgi:proprotein convertase subtilisin/kexin type 2
MGNGMVHGQFNRTICVCLLLSACGGGGGDTRSADVSASPAPAAASPAAAPATASPPQAAAQTGPDPLYGQQWHLKNTGQRSAGGAIATAGEDLDVEPVWAACGDSGGCHGEGVTIAVVDRSIEIRHEDLQQNIASGLSSRVYTQTGAPANGDPTPLQTDAENAHGTEVAGIAAARDNNGVGGRGVAPRASLVGYALLRASTSSNEADAMTFQAPGIAVSNNSWGPPDGTGLLIDSTSLWRDAIDFGLANGRAGLGTIYVWAAGNGYSSRTRDLSTYDGYASYRGVIAVGAVTAQGRQPAYSEAGANVWISAPGGEPCGANLAVTTTDLPGAGGSNTGAEPGELANTSYTQCMDGTSAAVPSVSGVAALVLQASPGLGWRDVRGVLAQSARRNDPSNPSWKTNGAGRWFSDAYGFGMADAAAAVRLARSWTRLPAQARFSSPAQAVGQTIPDNNPTGVASTLTVAGSGIGRIEWVDLSFNAADHPHSGDLRIVLTSPSGTEQVLAELHSCSGRCTPYDGWRFGIAHYLDEPADGVWKISVQDLAATDTGTFQSWQLTLYGH